MKRFMLLMFAFTMVGCGGETYEGSAPVIAGLTLSRTDVRRGVEFFASAAVMDVDGDLQDVVARFEMKSIEGDTVVKTSVLPWDVDEGATQIDVTAGLTLFGDADLGPYELVMTALDDDGHSSAPALVHLVVDQ